MHIHNSSWERGTNENTNGLIRRYFPKKTDFSNITEEELKKAQNALNNRPRKVLGYKTPNQIMEIEFLKQIKNMMVMRRLVELEITRRRRVILFQQCHEIFNQKKISIFEYCININY